MGSHAHTQSHSSIALVPDTLVEPFLPPPPQAQPAPPLPPPSAAATDERHDATEQPDQQRQERARTRTRTESASAEQQGQLVLEKFHLYESKTMIYVVASNQADSRYRILKIDRASAAARPSASSGSTAAAAAAPLSGRPAGGVAAAAMSPVAPAFPSSAYAIPPTVPQGSVSRSSSLHPRHRQTLSASSSSSALPSLVAAPPFLSPNGTLAASSPGSSAIPSHLDAGAASASSSVTDQQRDPSPSSAARATSKADGPPLLQPLQPPRLHTQASTGTIPPPTSPAAESFVSVASINTSAAAHRSHRHSREGSRGNSLLQPMMAQQALLSQHNQPVATATPEPSEHGGQHDESPMDESAHELTLIEDPATYTKAEINALIDTLTAGNAGGLMRGPLFYGLAGFVRFSSSYYMVMVRQRTAVALIGGHYVYHCDEATLRPIATSDSNLKTTEEARKLAVFKGVDLSKNFYFSYTYDITNTLQHNLTEPKHNVGGGGRTLAGMNDRWVWNHYMLSPALRPLAKDTTWLLPMVYGFVDQAKLSVYGRPVWITLIGRRSRHHAGARYLKRGVNEKGHVANEVEVEQIVCEAVRTKFHAPASPPQPGVDLTTAADEGIGLNGAREEAHRRPLSQYTSFVQIRGSIPVYWSQDSGQNLTKKPPIELGVLDPFYSAAALHFDDLMARYGAPISILNLIKKDERFERILLPEFESCVRYLNQFLPGDRRLLYTHFDVAGVNKRKTKDVESMLEDIAQVAIDKTRFFHTGREPAWLASSRPDGTASYREGPQMQSGILRTNCIDCVDRTNAGQFMMGLVAIGHQLVALGVLRHPVIPIYSDVYNMLNEMYHDLGDTLSFQYAGSGTVNTMDKYRQIENWESHSRQILENMRRFYANSFVDDDKQIAINQFLGLNDPAYRPSPALPRRDYRYWFTPELLRPPISSEECEERLVQVADQDRINIWLSFYRPRLFTEFRRHLAFKMNSTLKYTSHLQAVSGYVDMSPFAPRKGGASLARWLSARNAKQGSSTPPSRSKLEARELEDERAPEVDESVSEIGGIEALVTRLENPFVSPLEVTEYQTYVDQYADLELSAQTGIDVKDSDLYHGVVDVAYGHFAPVVEDDDMRLYAEAVQASRFD